MFQGQGKVREFCEKVRENLSCLFKSVKSQGRIFSFTKASFKVIDFDTLRVTHAGTVVLAGSVFFCIIRLFKVSEKSGPGCSKPG